MKKLFISFMVSFMILTIFTACGSNQAAKSKEEIMAELKEEVKAELKAEMEAEEKLKEETKLKEELEQKAKAEQKAEAEQKEKEEASKKNNPEENDVNETNEEEAVVKQDFENGVEVTGYLSCWQAPYEIILKDDYPIIEFKGKEYSEIGLGADIITQYVKKDYFTYNVTHGFPSVEKGPYFRIEIDESTAEEDYKGDLVVKNYRVISYDNVSNPELKDYSDTSFPDRYYQDAIYKLSYFYIIADNEDILKSTAYKESTDFREAVDKLATKGYEFAKEHDYYKVINKEAYNIDHVPTVNEMCKLLGIEITDIKTENDGGYVMYYSHYENDEISFTISHDEKLTGNEKVSGINIKGFEYSLYGIHLGDNLQDAYKKLGNKYKNVYDHHNDRHMKYMYNVDGLTTSLNSNYWDSNDKTIDVNEIVNKIEMWSLFD